MYLGVKERGIPALENVKCKYVPCLKGKACIRKLR